MMRKYWLQYHNYEKMRGSPSAGGISTNKASFKEELRINQDIIFLMVGLNPTPTKLRDCGVSPSILSEQDYQGRVYFIWEKFVARRWEFIGEREIGGFDYEIYGNLDECTFFNPPIVLRSPEFKGFWERFNLHGFLCLSNYGCPFPELAETDEGLVFRPERLTQKSKLEISGKVAISQDVWKGIEFIRQRLPHHRLSNLVEVCSTLRNYGYSTTADWIKNHPKEYLGGWKFGFQVQTEV